MRKLLFMFLCLAAADCGAEVFKCIEKNGKTIYQAAPCHGAAKEQQLDIKSDPAKEAEAKAKLEAVQSEYDSRKAAQEKVDKERAEQQRAAATLEFARRNAIAQQEQAQAQQRQAEALERQNRYNNNRPYFYLPPIAPRFPIAPNPRPSPQPNRNRDNPQLRINP
ncbi:MAG: DUF4124 domain-containing protein [Methylomonas sp.]|uniref:DUF4124 domain-containing protein n=1 Tax=Methylomonas sp. TaxID=418 RepID=UPI0025EA05D1|nr:DUF4124 domain-containing protein [Methylomonas sp.]MCK9608950.1 DUF4124 domain-containing protein [Methylomonas sp.]